MDAEAIGKQVSQDSDAAEKGLKEPTPIDGTAEGKVSQDSDAAEKGLKEPSPIDGTAEGKVSQDSDAAEKGLKEPTPIDGTAEGSAETSAEGLRDTPEQEAGWQEYFVDEAREAVGGMAAATVQNVMEGPEITEEEKNMQAIVQGLLHSRVIWRGNAGLDFWFILKQQHTVLSMWCAHDMNPFTRVERFSVWASGVLMALGFAFILADPKTGKQKGDTYSFIASAMVSIYLAIDGFIKVQAATCSCCQEGSMLSCCKETAEDCGSCFLKLECCVAIFWIAIGTIVAAVRGTPFSACLRIWLTGQALSWFINAVQCLFCFWCAWRSQSSDADIDGSSAYPHGREYPNDEDLMWGGDNGLCWCLPCCGRIGTKAFLDKE